MREELHFTVKRFIVQRLACFDTPTAVATAVKAEFQLELSKQRVAYYDPTTKAGAALDQDLKALFEATRKTFLADLDTIPIANKAVRLRALNRQLEHFGDKNAAGIVMQLCEAAAKELGDAYTNKHKHEHSGPDGTPIPVNISDAEIDRRIAAAAAELGLTAAQGAGTGAPAGGEKAPTGAGQAAAPLPK